MRHNPDGSDPGALPVLFDTPALRLRRDRAMRLGFDGGGDFLHRVVAETLAERLAEVSRAFPEAVVVGSGGGVHARALAGEGRLVRQIELSTARAQAAGADLLVDPDVLPLAPESADLAVSALELHWVKDPVGHLIQLRRALRPDGLMLAAMFGGQTLAELRSALAEAEAELRGGLHPRVAPMGEIRDLGGLLQRAGFAMPVADSERLTVTYETPLHLMRDLRAMGETNILTGRDRGMMRRDVLTRACEIYTAHFPAPGGPETERVVATFEIIFLTGWAPAPDQPQPLRPGSAQTRLADALGSEETSLPDKVPLFPTDSTGGKD